MLTVFAAVQDMRGGLQVLSPNGNYIDATPIEDAIVVNAGDLLARWSNDTIKSTKHRVVEPPSTADVHPARYSIAYFCNPNFDRFIDAIPSTYDASRPKKYEGINRLVCHSTAPRCVCVCVCAVHRTDSLQWRLSRTAALGNVLTHSYCHGVCRLRPVVVGVRMARCRATRHVWCLNQTGGVSDANAPRRQEDGKGDGQQHAGKDADHQGGVE